MAELKIFIYCLALGVLSVMFFFVEMYRQVPREPCPALSRTPAKPSSYPSSIKPCKSCPRQTTFKPCPYPSTVKPCTPCPHPSTIQPCKPCPNPSTTPAKSSPHQSTTQPCKPYTECRRRSFSEDKKEISRKLHAIHLQLKSSVSHKISPSPGLLLDLEGIIEQLDPAYALSKEREKPKEKVNTSIVLDVCHEEYLGEYHGGPFFHTGWNLTDCSNARPLPKVVTILINTVDYPERDEKHVDMALKGINHTYPGVRTYLAPKNDHIKELASKYQHVTVVDTKKNGRSLASVWNKLVSLVTTPYTLVARDIVHFDFTARLERQIRMISDTAYVGVVGGSFRNLTGHWRIGCRQTRMMNYVLKFQEGYHHSRKSCMFCDDLEGPFISKTKLLNSTKFNEKFSKEVIFEDFFLRVIRSGHLVMNCPDVMYYTSGNSSEVKKRSKRVWQVFAREWILVRILLSGTRHAFSCREISFKCNVFYVTRYAALPKCCLEQWGGAMHVLQEFCTKNNIRIELDSGSNLAAVKFNDYSPYDLDGDMFFSSMNFSFIKKNIPYFEKKGYRFREFKDPSYDKKRKKMQGGYFKYLSPDIYTEVWGVNSASADKYLPPELRNIEHFTKVQMDGHWINAMFSPGLYARNRYGMDVLKHSQSWLQARGMKSSWAHYKPGQFLKCTKPEFHSCLDKFPADGNLAFKVDEFP